MILPLYKYNLEIFQTQSSKENITKLGKTTLSK